MSLDNTSYPSTTVSIATSPDDQAPYDYVGAMQYIIAVIVVYSGAVTAMFIVRIFSRRLWVAGKYDQDYDTDRFLKSMPVVRHKLEQEKKQKTIEQLEKFHNFRLKSVKDTSVFGRNIMPLLALTVAASGTNIHQYDTEPKSGPKVNGKVNDLSNVCEPEKQPLTFYETDLSLENWKAASETVV